VDDEGKEMLTEPKIKIHPEYNRFQKFKILAHSDRIREIVEGMIPDPVEWVIYPSNVCGYACGHCIMAKEQQDHRKMLSKEAMKKIPIDATLHDIKTVIFSGGGDPLLNPYTIETARQCKERKILTGINNQGYLLDDPTPFNFVRYSVDAATAETYQKIHNVPKGDGWERVNDNIKRHANLRKNGFDIEMGLAFLITPLNWHETAEFCEWAQQYEPDFIHIRPAYLDADYLDKKYPGGGIKIKDEIVPNLRELSKKLHEKYDNVFFKINTFEGYWTPKLYDKCRSNSLLAVTSGDGAFLICQDRGIRSEENYLRWGNYNIQDFDDIWGTREHKKVIDSIDLQNCPRCVENGMNEIIQYGFIEDRMKMDLI
jgi:MoaA/NifB/PqqE/SkfB family radical SAM enzyme